ncbi:MAG: nucleotidyltransferase domain-containing protein [Candidatus Aenigmarchaeota archaeon]|nr:nucleotidyltransferase domain-containing protein [Candidatus Aenigmarchaeota archaeon]
MENSYLRQVSQFGPLSAYDIWFIDFNYDPNELKRRTFWRRTNIFDYEKQINETFDIIKNTYHEKLLYFGICGSYKNGTQDKNSDIDVISVVSSLIQEPLYTHADAKLIEKQELKKYLEYGEPLITNFFLNSKPFYDIDNIENMKSIKPVKKKAIPFLLTKADFYIDSIKIIKLVAKKYDKMIESINKLNLTISTKGCANIRDFYLKAALERMHSSSVSLAEALHIKENEIVVDLQELYEYIAKKDEYIAKTMKEIRNRRKQCSARIKNITIPEFEEFLNKTELNNKKLKSMI